MRKLLLLLIFCCNLASAQNNWISGAIEDSAAHKPLSGVSVSVMNDTALAVSNSYGLFRIAVTKALVQLKLELEGYQTKVIYARPNEYLVIRLLPQRPPADAIALAKARANISRNSNPNYTNTGIGEYTFFNETYGATYENKFQRTGVAPMSNFAVDVDRASYSNIRRFLRQKEKVPRDAVRIEEMVNYFHYNYPLPGNGETLKLSGCYTTCPWEPMHHLLQIVIRAQAVQLDSLPASNLVFLIDASGSMGSSNKLPLLQAAFRVLVNNLRAKDRVAIVAYASEPGVILPSTSGDQKEKILNAIDNLNANGATAGEAAIKMAYKVAGQHFIPNGNNRVILATDGDFNVGRSSDEEMEELITTARESGVLLTCLGVGMKNYKDSKLKVMAGKGNGNFAYVDDLDEANKIFAQEFGSTLFTIAKDVKAEVTFNPATVKSYRLIGYENKVLPDAGAGKDSIGGGIVGSGHSAVALYEILPVDSVAVGDSVLAGIRVSYRSPFSDIKEEKELHITTGCAAFSEASTDYRFAASVALFGMLLRNSAYRGCGNWEMVEAMAKKAVGVDKSGYRHEFLKLVKLAKRNN
ncbi:von Willebrand factor type A domain-containing protein [Chitinophaga sp. sic0106]|uniref:YfbK domain-containing protein n=1 Tax=Chitinophaga sp. sic0106 TaxID=2854785 RepID=UPI001C448FB7|nr:von Willebrand factor type A domain-containing protein [Chitinophaga sp. sic0106]MBV7533408.1 VWA domain-containing protein [Chitinophaga sp. sic0106]